MHIKSSSKLIMILSIMVLFVGVFSISSANADWYLSKVTRVIPRADGDCFVQFTSVDGKWDGVARGLIDGSDPGAKQILATFLTAMSLGYNISIEMGQVPSFTPVGVITGAGVSSP